MYAFGNLGYNPGAVLDVIEDVAQRRIQEFTAQNVSNTIWGLAKLSAHPHQIKTVACHACAQCVPGCMPHCCSCKERTCSSSAVHQVPSCDLQCEDLCRV